ncbi:MAG: site-specific integrase [Cyanobacteria bacterium P01_A01_bin.123]
MRRSRRAISPRKCLDLWLQYALFRKGQISPSTYLRDYKKLERRLERMKKEAPELGSSIEIRDWLIKHYADETARRTLMQLQAMGRWAMESELLKTNPFEGVPKHIRIARQSERAWAAFTAVERDRIIQEFDVSDPFYAPWVKFLFWTGCRPEEAAALRWRHVAGDCRELLISEASPVDTRHQVDGPQLTKNGKITRFPCNARLQRLLRSVKPDYVSPNDFVLSGVKGGCFDYHNFQTKHWRPLVQGLVNARSIAFYLPQYNCRHTFITLALGQMEIADVAYLVRTSPTVIYKHYAGKTRHIDIPEF